LKGKQAVHSPFHKKLESAWKGGVMMKTMTLLLVLFSVSTCSGQGGKCDKVDYAELKDMDKERLAMTFCDYKSRTDANQETIRQFEDFSFMEDARICMEEMFKVERIYKNRFGEDPPECGQ
jgi:hypothetical protein